jgi:hypothetical protein
MPNFHLLKKHLKRYYFPLKAEKRSILAGQGVGRSMGIGHLFPSPVETPLFDTFSPFSVPKIRETDTVTPQILLYIGYKINTKFER